MKNLFLALFLFPLMAVAQPDPVVVPSAVISAPVSEAEVVSGPAVVSPEDAGVASVASAPPVTQIVSEGKQAVSAVKDAADKPSVVTIATALSLCLFALLSIVRRFGQDLLSGNTVRLVTVLVGAIAALAGYLSMGMAWPEMLQMFLAGPGAIAVNELMKPLSKKKA